MSTKIDKKKVWEVTPQLTHVPNVVHEMVRVIGNQPYYEKWVFRRQDFMCGMCNRSDDVVFMRTRPLNLVVRSCNFCGFTESVPPINSDTGDEMAYKVESRPISVQEALEYVKKFGQERFPPAGLPKRSVRERRALPTDLEIK